jgi:hypothetical protein
LVRRDAVRAADPGSETRDDRLAQAIDELVKCLAEEAGVSEEQACAALKHRRVIVPRRERERRERTRDFLLLVVEVSTLLATLAAIHLILTQR